MRTVQCSCCCSQYFLVGMLESESCTGDRSITAKTVVVMVTVIKVRVHSEEISCCVLGIGDLWHVANNFEKFRSVLVIVKMGKARCISLQFFMLCIVMIKNNNFVTCIISRRI